MLVSEKVHKREYTDKFFPEGIPYEEVNGLERCAYCGSIRYGALNDPANEVSFISASDDGEKEYFLVNGYQVKLYREHKSE